MKPYRILFFDIDWTLYDHRDLRWSFSSLDAIKILAKQGYKIIICTARPYDSMKRFGIFDLDIPWDGYIASAGGIAYADGRYLFKMLMAKDDVFAYAKAMHEKGLTGEVVEPLTRKLLFPQTEASRHFYESYRESVPPVQSYHGEEATGLNLFCRAEYDDFFQKAFPDILYIRYFETAVDVMPQLHQKGEAIDDILAHYGFSKDEALGFGDDIQDISLADHVGTFVCMGNGKDEVKKHAAYVASPVWEDGVLDGLKHFGLI